MTRKKLYSGLVEQLESIPAGVGRHELLRFLQQWLQASLDRWTPELRSRYGLDEYASLDLSRYPIDESSLLPAEEVQQMRAVPPSSMDVFAMRLGEVFWQGLTVESHVMCPRCESVALRVLEDPISGTAVLACDICSWSQTLDGAPWQGEHHLRLATKATIDRWRERKR